MLYGLPNGPVMTSRCPIAQLTSGRRAGAPPNG